MKTTRFNDVPTPQVPAVPDTFSPARGADPDFYFPPSQHKPGGGLLGFLLRLPMIRKASGARGTI